MKIHLVDGTYELFRSYFAMPKIVGPTGQPTGAVRGLIQTLLALLREDDVTHVACAFDSEIRSFRNDLFDGYKTGEDTPADLKAQFGLAERAAAALGIVVWPMTEFEADDAIATAVCMWKDAPEVQQIVVCSPDKDLAQMVSGNKVVSLDRRRELALNEEGVVDKYGVSPKSIPDYLALVGDSADGIPGVPRWGAKSAAQVLQTFKHIENIPDDADAWEVKVRGAGSLAQNLRAHREDATLYKELATLRLDVPIREAIKDVGWQGANREEYRALCIECGFDRLLSAPNRWQGEDD
jgi:5'-3' exonuclease